MNTALPLPVAYMRYPQEGAGGSFGYQRSKSHVHQGIDLHAPIGTPVFAVQGGEIVSARQVLNKSEGKGTGPGYNLVVAHAGEPSYSWYMHLSKLLVGPGDKVATGQQIAESGNTMFSDKSASVPHLHFEILTTFPPGKEPPDGGVQHRVNPTSWLKEHNAGELGQVKRSFQLGGLGWVLVIALVADFVRGK